MYNTINLNDYIKNIDINYSTCNNLDDLFKDYTLKNKSSCCDIKEIIKINKNDLYKDEDKYYYNLFIQHDCDIIDNINITDLENKNIEFKYDIGGNNLKSNEITIIPLHPLQYHEVYLKIFFDSLDDYNIIFSSRKYFLTKNYRDNLVMNDVIVECDNYYYTRGIQCNIYVIKQFVLADLIFKN